MSQPPQDEHGRIGTFRRNDHHDLLSRYEFDTLFLDMIFWPLICGCDHCRARFPKEADAEIPATVDRTSPQWCCVQEAKWCSVGRRLMSMPISATSCSAVAAQYLVRAKPRRDRSSGRVAALLTSSRCQPYDGVPAGNSERSQKNWSSRRF